VTSSIVFKLLVSSATAPGAAHFDDVFYYFKTFLKQTPPVDSLEFKLIMTMVDLITSFAITGTPSIENVPVWTPVDKKDEPPKLLNINNDGVSMIAFPEYDRIRVFNDVLKEGKTNVI
jgi:carboxylesterase type B